MLKFFRSKKFIVGFSVSSIVGITSLIIRHLSYTYLNVDVINFIGDNLVIALGLGAGGIIFRLGIKEWLEHSIILHMSEAPGIDNPLSPPAAGPVAGPATGPAAAPAAAAGPAAAPAGPYVPGPVDALTNPVASRIINDGFHLNGRSNRDGGRHVADHLEQLALLKKSPSDRTIGEPMARWLFG